MRVAGSPSAMRLGRSLVAGAVDDPGAQLVAASRQRLVVERSRENPSVSSRRGQRAPGVLALTSRLDLAVGDARAWRRSPARGRAWGRTRLSGLMPQRRHVVVEAQDAGRSRRARGRRCRPRPRARALSRHSPGPGDAEIGHRRDVACPGPIPSAQPPGRRRRSRRDTASSAPRRSGRRVSGRVAPADLEAVASAPDLAAIESARRAPGPAACCRSGPRGTSVASLSAASIALTSRRVTAVGSERGRLAQSQLSGDVVAGARPSESQRLVRVAKRAVPSIDRLDRLDRRSHPTPRTDTS